ncbi:MAG: N-acetyltransferase [Bacteroides sp.]|nr:N-acetyltransferase [Bacteroides sp.]
MIRPFCQEDTERLVQIWLDASLLAHDFIPERYWKEKAEDMRTVYLPAAQVFVYEHPRTGCPEGFIAMVEDYLAALFVTPSRQGEGIGSQLLESVRKDRREITLAVYTKNEASLRFYRKQGFVCQEERVDAATGEKEWLMRWRAPDICL